MARVHPMSPTASTPAQEDGFAGRVALVTGGAGGIGRALTAALVERGARVVAADIGTGGDAGAARLASEGRSDVHLDVTRKSDVSALVAGILAAYGRIDLLVNVAGVDVARCRRPRCPRRSGIA